MRLTMTIKILPFLFLLTSTFSFGQMNQYGYKRELKGITDPWHKIILPDDIFGKTSPKLSDIRIYGITTKGDTLEAPYLLKSRSGNVISKEFPFRLINTSYSQKGYYFMFEVPGAKTVNQIKLDFKQENFDWKVTLEGSQDMKEWFTVIRKYRILSIHNESATFQFTALIFPDSKYRYFRIFIESPEKPDLNVASISQNDTIEGTYRNYAFKNLIIKENKENRETEIYAELAMPVPISQVSMKIKSTFDYYRPVTIEYVSDSFRLESGWKYNYTLLHSDILNSLESKEFTFAPTRIQKLKIRIQNQDNIPLSIDSIKIKGCVYELVARFTERATYYLTYGNENASFPDYDISRFTGNIPASLKSLNLGPELKIEKQNPNEAGPLFKSKSWLWAVMIFMVLILGWFSLKMIRKN
jgi:hypothetical protein